MTAAAAVAAAPRWISHRRLLETHLAALPEGLPTLSHLKQLHAQLVKSNLHVDTYVAPKLVAAYSRFRCLAAAHLVVDAAAPARTTHLFNSLLRACAHHYDAAAAAAALDSMQKAAAFPDNFTYPFLLKACSCHFGLAFVHQVHAHVIKFGFLGDVFVPNSLIDAYSKNGKSGFLYAGKVFDEMAVRDVVSWNSMIAGMVRIGDFKNARDFFDEMPERDTVSWNTVLDGYAKAGEMDEAFGLFERMPERNVVSWSTMLSGYCKRGDMEMARVLFDRMPTKNLVSWTIIVSGYVEKGLAKEASALFDQMEESRLELDVGAIMSVLAACAESGSLALGKRVHGYVRRSKLRTSTRVYNALIDMYCKCGCLDMASDIFRGMSERDLVSWNSMVGGLAMHGHGDKALDLFVAMKQKGIRPDGVTLIGVLCACTHMGLVEEGRRYFGNMERDYHVVPQIEHYGCMIDLLGRGGLLKEAFDLIKSMPWEPNVVIWGSLLSACRLHNNVEYAEEAANELSKLEPTDAGNYAVLSNIYAAVGRWDGMAKARMQMKGTGSQKTAGSSWIELRDAFHEFTVGDRTHPESDQIFGMVDRLSLHLRKAGYVPRAYS